MIYLQTLQKDTALLWNISDLFPSQFYLAGGTSIALQIGHRISIDLDFFSPTPIKKTLLNEIETITKSTAKVLVNTSNELTCIIQNVKVTFLYYPFDLKYPACAY